MFPRTGEIVKWGCGYGSSVVVFRVRSFFPNKFHRRDCEITTPSRAIFPSATILVKANSKISGLLDLRVRVHAFHLLAALGKSVGLDSGRWDTEIVRYLLIRIGRLGTKALLKRAVVGKRSLRVSKKLGGR